MQLWVQTRAWIPAPAPKDSAQDEGMTVEDDDILFTAIKDSNEYVIRKSIKEKNASLGKVNKDGKTPLLVAVESDNVNIVRILRKVVRFGLGGYIDINQGDKDGQTPLIAAIEHGNENIIREVISVTGVSNKARGDGTTPLIAAARNGNTGTVAYLSSRRSIDVDQADKSGESPLFIAARNGHADAVGVLIRNGAKRVNSDGETPLFAAIRAGHANVVEMVTQKIFGSNNKARSDGKTPLDIAYQVGNAEVADLLISKGATVGRKRDLGPPTPVPKPRGGKKPLIEERPTWGPKSI